jgi:choline dehydrogenase
MFNDNKAATGVQVRSTGGTMSWAISARKEIILSAGVAHTPQLLMISGIGPASTLQAYNIPVIKNLPGVGQNMHNSCSLGGVVHNITIQMPQVTAEVIEEYINSASGLLTNPGGDIISFERVPERYRRNFTNTTTKALSKWPSDWPETEFVALQIGEQTAEIGMLLTATDSRGNITIQSNSMLDKPIISTNWLLSEVDQEVAVVAYRRGREIWTKMDPNIITTNELVPGANVTSDEDLPQVIRAAVNPVHH